MTTPTLRLLVVLPILMLCGFKSCEKSVRLSDPPQIDCRAIAREKCDPPVGLDGGPLGVTEVDDVKNRAAWHACVLRHNAALECFDKLEEAGYVRK